MTAKKRRRNNRMALLLLPALVFIFFMGWSMYWIGNKKKPEHEKRKAPKKDNVTLLPAILEETEQMIVAE